MMASWVVYVFLVTGLFLLAAWILEKALRPLGLPTRWGWAAAMLGSQGVALAALLRGPAAPAAPALPPAPLWPGGPVAPSPGGPAAFWPGGPAALLESLARAFNPPAFSPDLDPWVISAWIALSLVAGATLLRIAVRLSALCFSWTPQSVDGRNVLISQGFGPAVVGLLRPAIVFPRWALEANRGDRELMLRHEEEHLKGGDIYLLFAALVLAVAIPWNLLLWAMGRRLRAAVEIDCDRRVLRRAQESREQEIRDYADLLLQLGSRGSVRGLGALTFSRPATFLEERIRAMTDSTSPGLLRVASLMALSGLLLFGACEVNGPALTQPEPQNSLEASAEESPASLITVQGLRVSSPREASTPEGSREVVLASGTTVNRDTGEPVGGVEVMIPGLEVGAMTNTDGRFLIFGIPPGDHELVFRHPDLGETRARIVFSGSEGPEQAGLPPAPTDRVAQADLMPPPGISRGLPARAPDPTMGSIVGSVTEAGTGAPVSGVTVSIPELDMGTMTNARGRFLLLNVPPGTYTLRSQREGFLTHEMEVEVRGGETAEADPALRR